MHDSPPPGCWSSTYLLHLRVPFPEAASLLQADGINVGFPPPGFANGDNVMQLEPGALFTTRVLFPVVILIRAIRISTYVLRPLASPSALLIRITVVELELELGMEPSSFCLHRTISCWHGNARFTSTLPLICGRKF